MLRYSANLLDVWAEEIVVAVRDIDRRVLPIHVAEEVGELGPITCVWG